MTIALGAKMIIATRVKRKKEPMVFGCASAAKKGMPKTHRQKVRTATLT